MAANDYLFTSESVSEGHPDKVCDRISDEVVDLYYRRALENGMPVSDVRVACETLATTNKVIVAGETRGCKSITPEDIDTLVRSAVRDIGYEQENFHWRDLDVEILLHAQSSDIAQGVDGSLQKDEGAGDQGIMFGYACRETESLMPAPIYYAHKILRTLSLIRKSGKLPFLGPDAKAQVSVRYINNRPSHVESLVISTQHLDINLNSSDIYNAIYEPVIDIFPAGWIDKKTVWHVNPTGKFTIGGPHGDCGLTGRKIIVDTYGGSAPHGGGAFSGKDPSKVDRSGAYAARYLARNIVAAELADRCTIQLSYAIGVSYPLSIYVNLHGTGKIPHEHLERVLPQVMDLSPRGIRTCLSLNTPIYAKTAAYGHFGRKPDAEGGFSWEREDLVKDLLTAVDAQLCKSA